MRSLKWKYGLAAVAAFVTSLTIPTQAHASTPGHCNDSDHCFVMRQLGGGGSTARFVGTDVTLHASELTNTNGGGDFTTTETWLAQHRSGDYWVEAGMAYGRPQGDRRYFFWADQRPGHGYSEHDDTGAATPSLTTAYDTTITYDSTTSFYADIGPWSGTSTGWPSNTLFDTLQAGNETSDYNSSTYTTASGSVSSLSYYSANNNYDSGWHYVSGGATQHSYPVIQGSNWGCLNPVTTDVYYQYRLLPTC